MILPAWALRLAEQWTSAELRHFESWVSGITDEDTRCHDTQCQVKLQCKRYVYRETGGAATKRVSTLRPAWQSFDHFCDHAMRMDNGRTR